MESQKRISYKIVNQLEIEGYNYQVRIPDGIIYVNGLPLVALEFKTAIQENTTIKEKTYHFELYYDGKGGNRSVQCSIVWELQESLISEDENGYYRQFDFELATEMVQVLVYANGKANMDEFPKLNRYMLRTKIGHYQQLQKQWEENNKKNSEREDA